MVIINKNKMNEIALGTQKVEISKLDAKNLFYEYDDAEKLITISARVVKEFIVDKKIINFENFQQFLTEQNPKLDGDFFIFSEFSLSIYADFEKEVFLEILIYADSVKSIYEKPLLKRYNDLQTFSSTAESTMIFIPYKSIGKYEFGMDEHNFIKKHNITSKAGVGVGGKKIYQNDNYIFRFDNNCFSQLNVLKISSNIIINNIMIEEYISENVDIQKSIIRSRTHIIFPEIGLAIDKEEKDREFFFFSENLLKFWTNINRPITSW
ncbi:hypothetical protein OMO38_00260 [Chryseobacterium sp. 09-1422]|jgi:hypothetical protein|uniref:Uncharacterized protein n=1 Tax=Chryseobacterium kimseyorum TaxID=2984028 RepID=A0ABT3HT26_9FLAO|nr:hypothetical protein [Chryseobacterium kimseyorum]MCW3166946.1 hypothetical protein [Chryseobacterium kimseyorum]